AYKNQEYPSLLQWQAFRIINKSSSRTRDVAIAVFVPFSFEPLKDRLGVIDRERQVLDVVKLIIWTVFMEPVNFLRRNLKFAVLVIFWASAVLNYKRLGFTQFHQPFIVCQKLIPRERIHH